MTTFSDTRNSCTDLQERDWTGEKPIPEPLPTIGYKTRCTINVICYSFSPFPSPQSWIVVCTGLFTLSCPKSVSSSQHCLDVGGGVTMCLEKCILCYSWVFEKYRMWRRFSITRSKIFLLHCRVEVRRDSLHNCQEKGLSFAEHHIAYFHAIFVVFLFSFNAEALAILCLLPQALLFCSNNFNSEHQMTDRWGPRFRWWTWVWSICWHLQFTNCQVCNRWFRGTVKASLKPPLILGAID